MNTTVTIVYQSRASAEFSSREARQQLKVHAQGENLKAGVTGVLLYCDGVFFQAIEGPASVVDRLYSNIVRDSRHHDIKLMMRAAISHRAFGNWSMALIETDETPHAAIPVGQRLTAIDALLARRNDGPVPASRFIEVFIDPSNLDQAA